VSSGRGQVGRILGFSAITIVFAVVQPFLLVGVPLALLLIAHGPHGVRSGIIATAILVMAFLGDRSGLWWFERGWALVLAGMFVWTVGWRPTWSFSAQALAALGLTIVAAAMILAISPSVWLDVDALMTARAGQSAQTAAEIVGTSANDMVQTIMQRVVAFQVLVFPALLGVSSIGALGLAVLARAWLRGDTRPVFGMLRSFRFNDHLVWLWLLGLILILAPVGPIAERVGGNAVFFMGALYVLRGMAVLLSLVGGISVMAGVLGGLVAVLVYPILALLLSVTLIVGLGDTWLNVRSRVNREGGE
jgi:hypothetical protein